MDDNISNADDNSEWPKWPNWPEAEDRPGYKYKIVQYGKCKITLYRPILDEAEEKKIDAYIKAVAESTLASYYKRMEDKERNEQLHHN